MQNIVNTIINTNINNCSPEYKIGSKNNFGIQTNYRKEHFFTISFKIMYIIKFSLDLEYLRHKIIHLFRY